MFNKKAIGPVVAVALLLIVSVSSVLLFQNWFTNFQSGMFSDISTININSIHLEYLTDNSLYIKNSNEIEINFTEIKIDNVSCNVVNKTLSKKTITEVDLNNCTNSMNSGVKEVVLVSDFGVYTTSLIFNGVMANSTEITILEGPFIGFAYGETLGYISFNGSNYGVNIENNNLFGFAYSEIYGYINFNGSNYGVKNNGGNLEGFAYGENIGYISFNGSNYAVTFDGTKLSGKAYSEAYGYLNFDYPSYYQVDYS